MAWQEKDDTSAFHALFDEPAGPLRTIGRATFERIVYELADRDFAKAEQILTADPKPEFEIGERRLVCQEFPLGRIKKTEGDDAAASRFCEFATVATRLRAKMAE